MGEPTAHRAGSSVLLLLLSVLFSAHAATAQVVGGSIGGIVTDEQASALPGVSLTVSAPPVKKAVVTAGKIQVKTGGVDASTPLGLGAVLTAASQTGPERFSSCRVSVRAKGLERRWSDRDRRRVVLRHLSHRAERDRQPAVGAAGVVSPRAAAGYTSLDNDWDNQIAFVKGT